MAAYKEKSTNTWRVIYRHTDWTGARKQSSKRGFSTKREALEWEREQLNKLHSDLDMTFKAFVDVYSTNMKPRLKQVTWETKTHLIRTKLLPYFGSKRMNDISVSDIIQWQNEIINSQSKDGKKFSQTYIKTIHNQINAIFNHAVRFYNLSENPVTKAGSIGKKETKEMCFWTKDEYLQFIDAMMDKPLSYYAFEMLYWTGIRSGELLALTPADFDFEKGSVSINKTFQRLHQNDVITEPKTTKSIRTISMPDFLNQEIKEYLCLQYNCDKNERMFPVTKYYLHNEMDRGAKETGVKRIRVHDIRHSHVSLLIDMGFSAVAIADRVGHESIDITYRYAHLFPSKQVEIADKLNIERKEVF
ncbi:MAG: site-specific integrase [Oscillospiraceae bacterium]|nr:site-specific integrase [Oscillospiraceae bacterium]